ncbi:type I restriction modification DNA specificity protein [Streptococcus suis]|uniref:restriction endonuclease subunit S n=1 Tax=Streptococcus suis TaxID=1307 RepID=UPI00069B1674|nr:type I restriction modification DNA specificity protein [Streptococcus suis]
MTRMKDSGIEWIGEVPEDWGGGNLKYYFDVQLGKMLQPSAINGNDIEIDYLRAINVQWDNISVENLSKMWCNPSEVGKYEIKNGDLLVCEGGEVGRCGIVEHLSDRAIIQNAVHRIRPTEKADVRFLNYYIQHTTKSKWFDILCNKATIAHLTSEKLLNTSVVLPSISEQSQIADFLDKKVAQLDKVKSLLEEQIKTLEDYRQSLIYETVTKGLDKTVPLKDSGVDWIGQIPEGWGTGKIKYYAEISAGSTPDRTNELFWNGDIPWMVSGEVNQGVVTHTAEKITKLGLRNTSTKLLSKGTVMLALNGQGKTKGTAAILNIETASNQSLASFDVNNEVVNGYYLYYYFVANYSNIRGLKGEDRDGLNLKLVSNIEIPLPNIDEQLKIADFLDKKTEQINQMIAIKKEQIENINKQRQILIYDYVTGKRRV